MTDELIKTGLVTTKHNADVTSVKVDSLDAENAAMKVKVKKFQWIV